MKPNALFYFTRSAMHGARYHLPGLFRNPWSIVGYLVFAMLWARKDNESRDSSIQNYP